MKPYALLLLGSAIAFTACTKHKSTARFCPTGSGSPIVRSATHPCGVGPLVIYKTRYDYSNNISVLLSADKAQVLAFPGFTDVTVQHPIPLANGYYAKMMLGDAFTSYTFADYAAHGTNYTDQEFLDHLIDCAPFTEYWAGCSIYDTGSLNNIIRSGQLSTYFEKLN